MVLKADHLSSSTFEFALYLDVEQPFVRVCIYVSVHVCTYVFLSLRWH